MGSLGSAPPLPSSKLLELGPGLRLLEPLSRRGHGPGLIILTPNEGSKEDALKVENGVPSPLMKWAEEGYTVLEIRLDRVQNEKDLIASAVSALFSSAQCQPRDAVGLVSYAPELWDQVASGISSKSEIKAAVIYGDISASISPAPIPTLRHLAGKAKDKLPRSDDLIAYDYPGMDSHLFATPHQKHFHYANESVSHTRSLAFLKPRMNGPYFDLDAIWDEHTYYEFENRSMEHTMATMVEEPYVNHIPTMTGGIGRNPLSYFYHHHFIFNNPQDTELELISRTTGIDRVIDEFIFKFTHDSVVDWLLPGVPPTNRKLELPFMAVVNIRGDRLYHEHIMWDQGTALTQLGLLPEYLPYPYSLPDGTEPKEGKKFEYRVPVAGAATAEKMRDKNAVPSNEMFEFRVREVDV